MDSDDVFLLKREIFGLGIQSTFLQIIKVIYIANINA